MLDSLKMVVVLGLICSTAGFMLASVKKYTEPLIEVQELTYVKGPAIYGILAGCDNDPIGERRKFDLPDGTQLTVFPGKKDGKLTAVAFESFGGGYGGPVGVMVGFDMTSDALAGIGITTHKETPGVGSRVMLPDFTGQFRGHSFEQLALKSKGGDVDAVSGATVSSAATLEAVGKALAEFRQLKGQISEAFR